MAEFKRQNRNKQKNLHFRVTEEEFNLFNKLSDKNNLKKTDFFCLLVDNYIKQNNENIN